MDFNKFLQTFNENFKVWTETHYFKIALFNIILVLLLLLRSAGYFAPYFILTVNIIVFISMVLSVILLNANSKAMFITSLIFWILTGFFKVVQIDVWSERAALYSYQALVIGLVLFIIENKQIKFFRKR